jgi:hypothetical protein
MSDLSSILLFIFEMLPLALSSISIQDTRILKLAN